MSSEDEEEEGQAQEEGRFDPRKQLNHVETNATLEDIERAKRRSKMVPNTMWRGTKKAVRFPGYLRHQHMMRIRRQKERAYQAYVIPFLETCKS